MSTGLRIRWEGLIAPVFALVVFAQACGFGWVYFDDPLFFAANPLLGEAPLAARLLAAWTVAPEANWMPVTWTVAIIADVFAEGSARAIHTIGVLGHALNAWLVWLVIRRLGADPWLAAACACVWAVHPLRMESVAWASALKDVLSGCFAFGMMALITDGRTDRRKEWLAYLLFVGSLLSKQVMIGFPVALLLWDYQRGITGVRSLILSRMKWWLTSLAAGLIVTVVNRHGMSLGEVTAPGSVGSGMFRGLAAFGHQFQQLLAPEGFSPEYLIESATGSKMLLGSVVLAGSLVAVATLLRKRGGRAAWCFVAAVALFFPLAGWTASPMEFTADRLSYIPHFFAIAGIGLAVKEFRFAPWLVAAVALVSAVFTFRLMPLWKNGDQLNAHMLKVRPGHPTALENRGVARAVAGDAEGAITDLLAVTRSHPQRASPWANAVRALAAAGRLEEAEKALDKSLAIHPDRPELRALKRFLDEIGENAIHQDPTPD